jgi:hypothetical protein
MPADELAAGAARLIGRLLLEFVLEPILEVGCYWLGFGMLRVVSFGQYPPAQPTPRQERVCQVVGVVMVMAIGIAVIAWASY